MEDNEKYSEMIEIPVSTCNMSFKHSRKKRKKEAEGEVKREILTLVNEDEPLGGGVEQKPIKPSRQKKAPSERRPFPVLAVECAIIVLLLVAIAATNYFVKDSGINSLVAAMFSSNNSSSQNDKPYSEYTLSLPTKSGEIAIKEGVMSFSGGGSIYALCDGVVESITTEAEKFILTISHGEHFKSVISGAKYAYYDVGSTVYGSVPVAFSSVGDVITVALYDGETLLDSYAIVDGVIVWQT